MYTAKSTLVTHRVDIFYHELVIHCSWFIMCTRCVVLTHLLLQIRRDRTQTNTRKSIDISRDEYKLHDVQLKTLSSVKDKSVTQISDRSLAKIHVYVNTITSVSADLRLLLPQNYVHFSFQFLVLIYLILKKKKKNYSP